ncbi:unnamed protein product [Thlaspi arvense]|uniref:Uncharacterized protein n=1 Tax=Thlaspi arvense TaxID=13288 RepID=A0AAU9S0H6_THLAR|nr:unnamed protein product [Thlaspi arvense]
MNGEQTETTFQVRADVSVGKGGYCSIREVLITSSRVVWQRKWGSSLHADLDVLGICWLNALGCVVWDETSKTVEIQIPSAMIKWHGEAATRGSEATALNAISNGADHLEN